MVEIKVNGIDYPIQGIPSEFFLLNDNGQRFQRHSLFFWPKIGQKVTTNGYTYERSY